MCNGEVGNFIMVKKLIFAVYISNDRQCHPYSVSTIEQFFLHKIYNCVVVWW